MSRGDFGRLDTSRFDTNSSSDIAQKFRNLLVYSLRVIIKNILGEYSLFLKPSAPKLNGRIETICIETTVNRQEDIAVLGQCCAEIIT